MAGVEERPGTLRAFAPALTLLGLSVFINYIDRGNLGVAAPLLKGELGLTGSQLGLLLAAFFWTYTGLQFVVGWAVDRFSVNLVLAAGFCLWSVATIATGLVGGFATLLLVRLLLGVGESVAFPSYSKILAQHVPERDRGIANAVIACGLKCGPAFGTFAAGLLIAHYGWRAVFIGTGIVSLLWVPAWMKWMPRGNGVCGATPRKPVPTSHILRNRSFWGASAGHFCGNYLLYFFVMWLPFYLVSERHLSMTAMAEVAGAYFALDGVFSLLGGFLSDRAIRAGVSPTLSRKALMVGGYTTAAVGLAGCVFSHFFLPYLFLVGIGDGIAASGIYIFGQTLAGPESAGRWIGLQNGFGNFAGLVSPALAGYILDWTGHLTAAFVITAAMMVVGAFCWGLVIERVEPVAWAEAPPLIDVAGSAA